VKEDVGKTNEGKSISQRF